MFKLLEYLNTYYNNNIPYKIIGNYKDQNTKILIKDDYGEYLIAPKHLKTGTLPSISSCTNKNELLISRFYKIHGDKYDYSLVKYTKSNNKIDIICSIHGVFKQTVGHHNEGKGCKPCSVINNNNNTRNNYDFTGKAIKIHGNFYDYSKSIYILHHKKIIIICSKHGEFYLSPHNHLNGRGCQECSKISISLKNSQHSTGWSLKDWIKTSKTSKTFESFKVYVIKCWNDKEEFYKIGRTFSKVNKRFSKLPYNFSIELTINSDAETVYKKEIELKRKFKKYKYKPNMFFNGHSECFSLDLPIEDI